MRFQGEKCILSFGMNFTDERMLLTGSIWFRRDVVAQVGEPVPNRVPFRLTLTEAEFNELRRWVSSDAPLPFQLPAPLRHLSRISPQSSDINTFELELSHEQLPPWWNWDIIFPLTIRLNIHSHEYAYLTNTLSREYWSANLSW